MNIRNVRTRALKGKKNLTQYTSVHVFTDKTLCKDGTPLDAFKCSK